MKRIIHDGDDDRSITTLRKCHQAMARVGKLLLVEMIMPLGNDLRFAKWLDIAMLVGCEHNLSGYASVSHIQSSAWITISREKR
jgi:hypothetical protein